MNLDNFLSEQRNPIIKKWFNCVVESYAPETSRLLQKESNQFANPVGHTLLHGIQAVYDELLRGMDYEKITPHLDRIVRVRAVQDFSPAQAISFIFSLKQIVGDELQNRIHDNRIPPSEIAAFERKVDQLALLAFNIYTQCREKLYEVRLNEFKARTFRLLQRANLLAEIPEWEPQSTGINHQET
jgi:hypothetical protein